MREVNEWKKQERDQVVKIKLTTCTTSCYNSPYLLLRSDGGPRGPQ